jgi:hypothetical protein
MAALPRLNGSTGVVLGEQLLTAAEAKQRGLPAFIERPRARLETAKDGLKIQIQPTEESDSGRKTAADRAEDDAWRIFYNWTGAMAGAPDGSWPKQDKIRALHKMLFGEGMTFINLSYKEEWTQSETRLKAIADGGYEAVITEMGGGPLLENLKRAHAAYGDVLGITAPVEEEDNPEVRENLLKLIGAIKEYVVKVVAWADPEEAGSQELSDALLLPLTQWEDKASRPKTAETDPATDV